MKLNSFLLASSKILWLLSFIILSQAQAEAGALDCVKIKLRSLMASSQHSSEGRITSAASEAHGLDDSVLKLEPKVMKPMGSTSFPFKISTKLPPNTRELPGKVGQMVNRTVERVVAKMNDGKEWTQYISKLQEETRALMLRSGNPEAQALAQEGKLSREYMLRVITARARARGQGVTVVNDLAQIGADGMESDLAKAVGRGDLFIDRYWKNGTVIDHGVDVHMIQMDFVDSVVASGMKGNRAGFYESIYNESLLPKEEGYRNTFWDLLFDAQSVPNMARAASPEDLTSWLRGVLPVQ